MDSDCTVPMCRHRRYAHIVRARKNPSVVSLIPFALTSTVTGLSAYANATNTAAVFCFRSRPMAMITGIVRAVNSAEVIGPASSA